MQSYILQQAINEYIMTIKFTDSLNKGHDAFLTTRVTNDLKLHAKNAVTAYLAEIQNRKLNVSTVSLTLLVECLWYDRNGHGISIVDSANMLGVDVADQLRDISRTMGSVDTFYTGGCLSVSIDTPNWIRA